MRPAVFLGRDGTIIEDRGDLRDPSQAVLFPETVEALKSLQRRLPLFIVTNQSGIAKGTLTPDEVERVNASVIHDLAPGRRAHRCGLRLSPSAQRRVLVHQTKASFPSAGRNGTRHRLEAVLRCRRSPS